MCSNDDLNEHIHKFRKIHNDLLSNLSSTPDFKISKPFVTIILINSLPSEYTPLVQSLLTNFKDLALARLFSLLKIEATRHSSSNKSDTALYTNRNQNSKPRFHKKKDNHQQVSNGLKCSLGHQGHTDENCKVRRYRAFIEYEKSLSKAANPGTSSNVAQSQSVTIPESM